jgi:hypothetical protein
VASGTHVAFAMMRCLTTLLLGNTLINASNLITTMMCMFCGHVQGAGQECTNEACKKKVSAYYCKECKLWDNDPNKNIYRIKLTYLRLLRLRYLPHR